MAKLKSEFRGKQTLLKPRIDAHNAEVAKIGGEAAIDVAHRIMTSALPAAPGQKHERLNSGN